MYISYTHSLLIQTSPCYWSGCLIQVALLCQDTSQPSSLLVTNLLQTEYLPFLLCVKPGVFKSNRNFPGKKSSLQKTDCCVKFVKFVLFGTWFQINSIFTGNDVWTSHVLLHFIHPNSILLECICNLKARIPIMDEDCSSFLT